MTAVADSTQELLARFREAANRKGAASPSPRLDHHEHLLMAEAFWALEDQGSIGRDAFRSLLGDASPHVRIWVAAQLLSEGDASVRSVLQALRHEPGTQGLAAETVLAEHEAGNLCSPFGERGA